MISELPELEVNDAQTENMINVSDLENQLDEIFNENYEIEQKLRRLDSLEQELNSLDELVK